MDAKIISYTASSVKEENTNLFSNNKPKDLISGTSSGIKNITKGILAGITSVIVLPIFGAKDDGVKGFFKGLGVGLCGGILLPLAGITTGGVQILRGIYNTPEAINSKIDGKIWDKRKKQWILYNLKEETINIKNLTEEEFLSNLEQRTIWNNPSETEEKIPDNNIIDNEYYEILDLDKNATQEEIKNSYKKLAMKWHPDKNKDNKDEAEKKFKSIGEAYQILGDPEKKKQYDTLGKEGIDNNNILDSNELFCLLFGTDELNFFIGELSISMIMSLEKNSTVEIIKFKQLKREINIANNLVEFLQKFIDNEPNLENYYQQKKEELINTPFGKMVVSMLGNLYIEIAQNYLGVFVFILNSFSENKRILENKYKLSTSLMKIMRDDDNDSNTKNLNNFIDVILSLITIDLENTIQSACFKILQDTSVSKEIRKKRAEALIYIGNIFYDDNINQDKSKEYILSKIANK